MPPQVFVNDVDLFTTQEISKYIASAAVGGTTAEDEDDEEEDTLSEKETYEIVGTLHDPKSTKPKWVSSIVDGTNEADIAQAVLQCQYVICNIGSRRSQMTVAKVAVDTLAAAASEWRRPRSYICVSSVLTWAKTRPADIEDLTAPILEEEYKRRRAHNKYRAEIELEKHILQQGRESKGKLQAYVVCSGLQYGAGEDVFHHLFKTAWLLTPEQLPCPGKGENVVPTIHIHDLCAALVNVIESPPEQNYILATDSAASTLMEMVTCLANQLGTGRVVSVPLSDAPLDVTCAATIEELLTIDVRLESAVIKEMNITWRAQEGLIEGIEGVLREYRDARNLNPLKLFVHGPPMCRKTEAALALASEYKLHYVSRQGVIDAKMAALEASAQRLEPNTANPVPEDELESVQADKDKLFEIQSALAENKGKHDDEVVNEWVRDQLQSMACRNHGYVLDGFPVTEEEAAAIFAPGDDAEDPDAPDPLTVPQYIFAFELEDDVCLERARALPESATEGTVFGEESMAVELAAFRKANTDEKTILNYFDFKEIHPVYLDCADMTDVDVLKKIRMALPAPRNYGPTAEEQADIDAANAQRREMEAREAAVTAAHAKKVADEEHEKTQREWEAKTQEIRKQEAEALEASSLPLRKFLMNHVMPTLTQGLAEVCKTRPEDPIDTLAEYLFKSNPQVE